MTQRRIIVVCSHCGGSGRTELTGVYLGTLIILQNNPGINAAALARIAKCNGTAMCQRLKALQSLRIARKVKNGRENLWFAV